MAEVLWISDGETNMITQERLKELLDYDPETGVFRWRATKAKCIKNGDLAGSTSNHGYIGIFVDGHRRLAHRLAWLYMFGVWPDKQIDHINGIRGDNKIVNLRLATQSENSANGKQRTRNLKGAHFMKTLKKWRATLTKNYKQVHVGLFASEKEAHEARMMVAKQIHGEFARAK